MEKAVVFSFITYSLVFHMVRKFPRKCNWISCCHKKCAFDSSRYHCMVNMWLICFCEHHIKTNIAGQVQVNQANTYKQ